MQLFSIVLGLWFVAASAAQAQNSAPTQDRTQTNEAEKESVQFNGKKLVLAFQSENDGDTIKEYIPVGEDLKSWTHLAAIFEYARLDNPQEVVNALVKELSERNPPAASSMRTDPQTQTVTVDFLVWPEGVASPEQADYVEYNIFKYQKRQGGGLIAQQYAIRAYKDIPDFLKKLPQLKERLVGEMTKNGLIRTAKVGE